MDRRYRRRVESVVRFEYAIGCKFVLEDVLSSTDNFVDADVSTNFAQVRDAVLRRLNLAKFSPKFSSKI